MRLISPIAAARLRNSTRHCLTMTGWAVLTLGVVLMLPTVVAFAQSGVSKSRRQVVRQEVVVDPAGWMQDESLGHGQVSETESSEFSEGPGDGPANGVPGEAGNYFDPGAYPSHDGFHEWTTVGQPPLFPNRPHLIPRTVDRLRWRPLFPNRPYLRGSWPGGPPLEEPRTFWLNPFAVQQGLGNFLFRGNQPADTGSLGFPFSVVPSHWVDRVPRPYLGHGQPYVGPRHIDRGQPLMGSSWANRPFFVDGYTGALFGWNLTDNLDQTHGTISGVRLGWDFEHFWGTQFGLGFGSTNTDPGGNDVSIRLADVSVLYYPWGDSRWRPYTGLGFGAGKYTFADENGGFVDEFAMQVPLSLGVKYAFRPWWALRLDATNYFVLPANELNFVNQLALTLGMEVRFGGRRRSYFPYSPSIQLR